MPQPMAAPRSVAPPPWAQTPAIDPSEVTVHLDAIPPGRSFRSGVWPVEYQGNTYWIVAEIPVTLPLNDQARMLAEFAARQIRVALEVTRTASGPVVAPTITSPLTATATTGTAFNYQITATGFVTSFNATGLPPWATINVSNGRITGTPTAAGTFPISISATNAGGTDTQTLTLTVSLAVPVVSAGAITGTPGTAITAFNISATNPPILSYAVTPALPAALSLNTTTGAITGTPAAASSGTFSITATNAGGTSAPANLTITITAAAVPAITSPLTYRVAPGGAVSYQMAASNGPITAWAATGLPAGVTVNTSTGLISGTAPATLGDTSVTLTATNAGGTSAPATLVFTVAAGWQITNELPGGVAVITIPSTKAALGAITTWTGWLPAYATDVTDATIYPPAPPATPATQTVRLYAHFSPYTAGTEVEVPSDNFFNAPVTGNAVREWGYDSGDNTIYLNGGQNGTGNPIRLRLEKS